MPEEPAFFQTITRLTTVKWGGTIVKATPKETYIVETKGREDVDDPLKIERLRVWCQDINAVQQETTFIPLYIKQEEFGKYHPKTEWHEVKL